MISLTPTLSCLLALGAVHGATALDAAGWRNQSIYQVITDRFARTDGSAPLCDASLGTACGGTWKGITNQLDYIQNLGATAVWISPIVKNVEGNFGLSGDAYHGFWTEDLYSLNEHFGTEADLKELADSLHARGMYLMVDIAPNHVGLPTSPGNYSNFKPFNKASYFHDKCSIQWNNRKSEQLCWDYTADLEHKADELPDEADCFGLDFTSFPEDIRIKIPTVHIVGAKDPRWSAGVQLAYFCDDRKMFDHGGGHDIPRTTQVSLSIAELLKGVNGA